MTGLNFKVMQSRLATFTKDGSTSFNILLQTLKNAHLVSNTYGKGDHPFLYRVIKQQPSDIVQFYKIYLNEKVLYLQSDIPDNAIFLHGERKDGRIETSSTIEILPRDISNAQFNFLGNSLNHIYDSCCCQTASKANEETTLKRLSTVQHRKEDATLHT